MEFRFLHALRAADLSTDRSRVADCFSNVTWYENLREKKSENLKVASGKTKHLINCYFFPLAGHKINFSVDYLDGL